MPLPSSYNEADLITYLDTRLGAFKAVLGWTDDNAGNIYGEVVIDTLLAYGAADVSQATDLAKLRALASYFLWRAIVDNVSARFDYSADGGDYSLSQQVDHARKALADAEREAIPYLPAMVVKSGAVVYPQDVYLTEDQAFEQDENG